MGQRDFPRPGHAAAAGQACGGNRVVRASEGPPVHQRRVAGQEPQHRVYLGDFQRFLPGHIRQNRRQPPGQHALAGARGPHQQHVVPAGCGNFQRPLAIVLPLYVGVVQRFTRGGFRLPGRFRRYGRFAVQVGGQPGHIPDRIYRQPVGQRRLRRILRRHIQFPNPRFTRGQRHGQDPGNRAQPPFQAQFPQKRRRRLRQLHIAGRAQDPKQNRQIINRSGFPGPGRRQVQRDAADREGKAAVFHRCSDTVPRLPDRRIRKPHHVKRRQPVGEITFHQDLKPRKAGQPQRPDAAVHRAIAPFPPPAPACYVYYTAHSRKIQTNVFRTGRSVPGKRIAPVFFSKNSEGSNFTIYSVVKVC